jgi:hypothetical protein
MTTKQRAKQHTRSAPMNEARRVADERKTARRSPLDEDLDGLLFPDRPPPAPRAPASRSVQPPSEAVLRQWDRIGIRLDDPRIVDLVVDRWRARARARARAARRK